MPTIFQQSSNYYYLISGLPDLQMEDSKGFLSPKELLLEIEPQLSSEDAKLLRLLYAAFDNANFLAVLADKDAAIDARGVLTNKDWEELLQLLKEGEADTDSRLLPYFIDYYNAVQTEEDFLKNKAAEDYLSGLYYKYAMQSSNEFLNAWFEFNLHLNNLLTAVFCRKHEIPQELLIVGDTEICQILKTTHARDFGIANLFPYTEEVIKLAEETDLLEREKRLDAIKWDWLEEHTFFHYFSIERVLAHVLKVHMLQRWKMLSTETGAQIFRELLATMKQGVTLDA